MDITPGSIVPVSSKITIDRSNFAAKSQAALRRERDALEIFDEYRIESSAHPNDAITDAILLPPWLHLTNPCWKTFRKYVSSFPGWTTKRRVATPEEKIAAKAKRKGQVYFVMVSFRPDKVQEFHAKQAAKKAALQMNLNPPVEEVTPVSNEKQVALEDTVNKQQDNANAGNANASALVASLLLRCLK